MDPRARTTWALVGLTFAALLLRLLDLGGSDLWLDECYSVSFARMSSGELREALRHDPTSPLLYLLVRLSLLLEPWLGQEAAARLPSALGGALGLPLLYAFVAGRAGPRAALCAAACFALNAGLVHHAREARFYALVVSCAAAAHLAADRLRASGSWRAGLGLGIAASALVHLHAFGLFLVCALALSLLRRPPPRRRALLLPASLCTLALLPLLWLWSQQLRAGFEGGDFAVSARLFEGLAKLVSGTSAEARQPLILWLPLLALGGLAAWRQAREELGWLLCGVGLPILIFSLAPPRVPLMARHFAFLWPLAFLLVARGAAELEGRAQRRGLAPGRALSGLTLALVLAAAWPLRETLRETSVPQRALVQWLQSEAKGARILVHTHGARGPSAGVGFRVRFRSYAPPALLERCVGPFTLKAQASAQPTATLLLLRPRHARALDSLPPGWRRLHPRLWVLPPGEAEPPQAAIRRLAELDRTLPGSRPERWEAVFGPWLGAEAGG